MDTVVKKKSPAKPYMEFLRKWRWAILTAIGASLVWVEIQEFIVLRVLNQAFHYMEAVQYAILIVTTGILIESYARSNHAYKKAINTLEHKHALSLELAEIHDQESLVKKLAELPGRLVDAEETYILTNNVASNNWDITSHWAKNDTHDRVIVWNPKIPCNHCLEKESSTKEILHLCVYDEDFPYKAYSLMLSNRGLPATIIKFRLRHKATLTNDEKELFEHLADEIIGALQSSQDRKNLMELQSAEAAMAERRFVSAFVHDQLAQNLGYLHLKLDQYGTNGMEDTSKMHELLLQLRDVANESYEIVRNILKKIQPETVPHLTNLLLEHSRAVSRRARFSLDFKTIGNPVPITPTIQQPIFFTFCEILNNIEKHAKAAKVEVLVMWNIDGLDISVADDGVGFKPQRLNNSEQFGLEIVQERVQKLRGKMSINSQPGKGTMISISIPLKTVDEVPA